MKIRNSNEWQSLPVDSVKPDSRQVRGYDRRKIVKLKKLIGHFGQVAPIIIDTNLAIIDGHAVWLAMRELGSSDITAITVGGLSDPEIKALRLALNRLTTEAAWDNEQLRAGFEELVNLSFDLDPTAFDTAEIDPVPELDFPTVNVFENEEQIPAVEAQAGSEFAAIVDTEDLDILEAFVARERKRTESGDNKAKVRKPASKRK